MPVSSSVSTTTFRTSDRKVNYLVARHLALPRELHTLTGNLCESHPRLEFGSNCSRRTPPPVENSAFGPPASSLYSFTLTARPTTRIIMAQYNRSRIRQDRRLLNLTRHSTLHCSHCVYFISSGICNNVVERIFGSEGPRSKHSIPLKCQTCV